MNSNLSKILSIVLFILIGVSALAFALFMAEVIDEGLFLGWAFTLFGLATFTAVAFAIYFLVTDIKKAIKSIISIGVLIVGCLVAYALASSDSVQIYGPEGIINYGGTPSKIVGGGIIAMYILLGAAFVAVAYSGIAKRFK